MACSRVIFTFTLLPKLGQQKKVFQEYNALRLVVLVLLIRLLYNLIIIVILNISDNYRIKPVYGLQPQTQECLSLCAGVPIFGAWILVSFWRNTRNGTEIYNL